MHICREEGSVTFRDPVATSLKHSFKSGLPCKMPQAFLTPAFGRRFEAIHDQVKSPAQGWTLYLVGVRGLEPPALRSQTARATNCATPRPPSSTLTLVLSVWQPKPWFSSACRLSFPNSSKLLGLINCLNTKDRSYCTR